MVHDRNVPEVHTSRGSTGHASPQKSKVLQNGIGQFSNHVQELSVTNSGGPLENHTWYTEWKTGPLTIVQLLSSKTKLWKLLLRLPICIPSLIVQWPARNSDC